MLEKSVEQFFKNQVKQRCPDALCLKFVSPGFAGVPDRIVLLPGGRVIFAELKRPGKTPRKLQTYVHGLLRRLGFTVFACVDTKEKALEVVWYCEKMVQSYTMYKEYYTRLDAGLQRMLNEIGGGLER